MKYKIGDVVIKARPYSTERYCAYGGESRYVPIGTIGTIYDTDGIIKVKFATGLRWSVDISEIELYNKPKQIYRIARFMKGELV